MQLNLHNYKYYPYEMVLAQREIQSLLAPIDIHEKGGAIYIDKPSNKEMANRLVYFASSITEDNISSQTQQYLLEQVNGNGAKRQSTRYSAHGLHEYKGKFNPQMAKAILNIFNVHTGQLVLDPFCGSGTSLVECTHLGIKSIGIDINPLAVYLANAKLESLGIPADRLEEHAKIALKEAKRSKMMPNIEGERGEYLVSWFPAVYLADIEHLRLAIESADCECSSVLLAIASNLLRDYSLQEPNDLRIRRRKSAFPTISFFDAFETATKSYCSRLAAAQEVLGVIVPHSRAVNVDCKNTSGHPDLRLGSFDLALTSPPYATALPYIDTQRLSLVWLGLTFPTGISLLEAELVGSREIRGQSKKGLLKTLETNERGLPENEANFCIRLQNALEEYDGFRRQVVPRLLYRYFADMADALSAIHKLVKPGSPFALIIGGNHTVLGGSRFEIETPAHLANIASSRGWQHVETIPLQTYKRYGLHMSNSTNTEALVILRASHP
jgi:site-specific DNA-methyltransferase (cytosine-N4-specific)